MMSSFIIPVILSELKFCIKSIISSTNMIE
nr:MAG TPA: hypothetical protein [Caudoviricetes sp.]